MLSATKDLDKTYMQCQKAYYCYLEYIEQMNKTNFLHNLNNLNAILFVYKKTVAIEGKGIDNDADRPLVNHFFSTENLATAPSRSDPEFSKTLNLISCITKTILFFTDELCFETETKVDKKIATGSDKTISIDEIVQLTENHLRKTLLLCFHSPLDEYDYKIVFDYIALIQEKLAMDYETYHGVLSEFYKKIKQLKRTKKLPSLCETHTNSLRHLYSPENLIDLKKLIEQKKYTALVNLLFTF